MAVTRNSGPLVITGASNQSGDSNPTPGPSAFAHGSALLDPRFNMGGAGDSLATGWYASSFLYVLDQAPAAMATTNLVAAAVPVAGTPMTLAAASTGITVLASPLAVGNGLTIPTGARVADGNPALLNIGAQLYGVAQYDPRTMISRNFRVTSAGADTGTITATGYDTYGQIMHETVTMAGIGLVSGKKAFKAFTSFVPAGSLSGSNVSIGTGDVFGLPIAAWEFPLVKIYWASTLISATTGFVAAVATTPTAITGDVRGTYAVQSASDGSKLLQVYVSPAPWQLTHAGLYGAVNF